MRIDREKTSSSEIQTSACPLHAATVMGIWVHHLRKQNITVLVGARVGVLGERNVGGSRTRAGP